MEAPAPLRKHLALVFCDIAGFTHLMAQEGDLVASALLREFYEHAGRLGREHHSLLVKFIADGFLAAFEHVDDAMPFVISVQSLLSENPTFIGRSLGFKFSLHYGDVLVVETSYGSDVFGEEVNVAAHLNDLAQPHQMVVSQAALERMPTDYRARAGESESRQLKGVGDVEFRRVNLRGW
jgi:class 3 adenylate cyclase